MNLFPLTVASVDTVHFQGEVISAVCPGIEGELTVLPHHAPLVTPLRAGTIRIKTSDDQVEIPVSHGILEVHKEGVTVLL